jgi:ribonuclease Z
MSARELVVLGTSAQVPTRQRNQNGYVLRWDDQAILFDPGEGTQRQMLLAGISTSSIKAICITHFHGDHCLGLPGVLARFTLDQLHDPVDLYFPASGAAYIERLRHAAVFDEWRHLRPHPMPLDGAVIDRGSFQLIAAPLDHTVDTLGWRLEEPDRRHVLAERLARHGIEGPEVGRLVRTGSLDLAPGRITLDEVSEPRTGQRFAFIMDTAPCDAAIALATEVDLVVCESTFLAPEEALARRYRHLTARQAGQIAAEAGARRLVLTHFSQRYPDETRFVSEAGALSPDVVAARDFSIITVPRRDRAEPLA